MHATRNKMKIIHIYTNLRNAHQTAHTEQRFSVIRATQNTNNTTTTPPQKKLMRSCVQGISTQPEFMACLWIYDDSSIDRACEKECRIVLLRAIIVDVDSNERTQCQRFECFWLKLISDSTGKAFKLNADELSLWRLLYCARRTREKAVTRLTEKPFHPHPHCWNLYRTKFL